MAFRPLDSANSFRIVPGAASAGSVAPMTVRSVGDGVRPLQRHREAGAAGHEAHEIGEERALAVHRVEGAGLLRRQPHQAGGAQGEAGILQVRHDLSGLRRWRRRPASRFPGSTTRPRLLQRLDWLAAAQQAGARDRPGSRHPEARRPSRTTEPTPRPSWPAAGRHPRGSDPRRCRERFGPWRHAPECSGSRWRRGTGRRRAATAPGGERFEQLAVRQESRPPGQLRPRPGSR